MMPPQMQQPQEMLGQPMPGMMPPQEQMMARGGYMELGGYDMPFVMAEGGYAPTQRVKIMELPKANNGKIVIDRSKYASDREYDRAIFDALAAGKTVYNEKGEQLKGGEDDFEILEPEWDDAYDPDGELAKLYGTEDPSNPGTYIMNDDQKIIAANMYRTEKYLREPETTKLIANKFREAARDAEIYKDKDGNATGKTFSDIITEYNSVHGTSLDPSDDASLDAIKDEFIIDALHSQNVQASRIAAAGINTAAFHDSGKKWASNADIIAAKITNPVTGELVEDAADIDALKTHYQSLGISSSGDLRSAYASSSPLMEQASYLGFMKAANDKSSYAAGSNEAFGARYIFPDELGVGDEPFLYGSNKTTPLDGWEGNTDLGQTALGRYTKFNWFMPEDDEIEEEECNCKEGQTPRVIVKEDGTKECTCEEERIIEQPGQPASWWLQDTINTFGAMGDASLIQKQQPFDPGADLRAPLARYDDPTKELDSNLGLYRQTADTMSQFAGPQGLTSRLSQARGTLAKNASDIAKRYNTRNLNLANAQEVRVADVANKQALLNREVDKGIYDATMLAEDRFNKEKLASRLNRRKLLNTAITNRMETDALNQMYPDYAVDPSVGGKMYHTPNYRNPNASSATMSWDDAYAECSQTTSDSKLLLDCIRNKRGTSSSSNNVSPSAAVMAQYGNKRSPQSYNVQSGKFGGPTGFYVYGGDVYPF